jgi:hypothetical protein
MFTLVESDVLRFRTRVALYRRRPLSKVRRGSSRDRNQIMKTSKRPKGRARLRTSRVAAPKRAAGTGQIALRYCAGAERKLRAALAGLGAIESYPAGGILILHTSSKVSDAGIRSRVRTLEKDGLVLFSTPVLRDPWSGARQVLTGEITLRLKPGECARQTLAALREQHGIRVKRRNQFEPTQYVVRVPDASCTRTREIARSLGRRRDVAFAVPNFITDIKRALRAARGEALYLHKRGDHDY